MVNLSQACTAKKSNDPHRDVLDFQCEYCGQEYSEDSVNLAVFLYGVIFLFGKNTGYMGIVCPRCMKTMMRKGDKDVLNTARKRLSSYIQIGDVQFCPNLKYHSPLNYSREQVPWLKGFDVLTWHTTLNGDRNEFSDMALLRYENENPWITEDYLRSYVIVGGRPTGVFFSVWWFREEQIDDLLKIENEEERKVFPRYVHRNSAYEDVDRFCWNNRVCQSYIKNLCEHRPLSSKNFVALSTVEGTEQDFSITFDFMNILAADPVPWDFAVPDAKITKAFWKTELPFRDAEVPKTLTNFDPSRYERPKEDAEHIEMVHQARSNFTRDCVQSFLYENHSHFIAEYMELVRTTDFSYAMLWKLKEAYLGGLCDHIRTHPERESVPEHPYAFYQEGPTWKITYEGKTLRGLKGNGFKYIHYLLCNRNKQFHTDELAELDGIMPNDPKQEDYESTAPIQGRPSLGSAGWVDHRDMTYGRAKQELKDHWRDLRKELEEATKFNDPCRIEKAERDLHEFERFSGEYEGKGREVRKFMDQSTRTKNRISKSIERALNTIKKHDPKKIWPHFYNALKPVNDYKQSYRPNADLDWKTDQ